MADYGNTRCSDEEDADLLEACRAGDEAAWRCLVDRYSKLIYGIPLKVFGLSLQEAEDVYQDTFIQLYEHLPQLRNNGSFRAWLGRIVRNQCLDRMRRNGREQPTPLERLPAVDPPPEDHVTTALAMHAELSRLPPACREVLARHFLENQSYREIARQLGLPPGTVASRISRCLVHLRLRLAEEEEDSFR